MILTTAQDIEFDQLLIKKVTETSNFFNKNPTITVNSLHTQLNFFRQQNKDQVRICQI